jgi:hypothetical protein
MAKTNYFEMFLPYVRDSIILIGFYFSLKSANDLLLLSDTLLAAWPAIVSLSLLAFTALFALLLFTDKTQLNKVIRMSQAWNAGHPRWKLLLKLVVDLAVLIIGFVQFILMVVFLFAANFHPTTTVPKWISQISSNVTLGIIIMYAFMFTFFLLAFLGSPNYHKTSEKKDEATFNQEHKLSNGRWLTRHPLLNSLLFATAATVSPIWTGYLLFNKLNNVILPNYSTINENVRASLLAALNFVFGILLLTVLNNEVIFATFSQGLRGPTTLEKIISRLIMVLVYFYLPLKIYTVMVEKQKHHWWLEFGWALLFFAAQALIIMGFAWYQPPYT